MVERTSCTSTDERDEYGNHGRPLSSRIERCKLCGARVLRLYDDGICLMCKINRIADSATVTTRIFDRPGAYARRKWRK